MNEQLTNHDDNAEAGVSMGADAPPAEDCLSARLLASRQQSAPLPNVVPPASLPFACACRRPAGQLSTRATEHLWVCAARQETENVNDQLAIHNDVTEGGVSAEQARRIVRRRSCRSVGSCMAACRSGVASCWQMASQQGRITSESSQRVSTS